MTFFIIAQKVVKYLGYFWKKIICNKDLSKVAQTGHTGLANVSQEIFKDKKFINKLGP